MCKCINCGDTLSTKEIRNNEAESNGCEQIECVCDDCSFDINNQDNSLDYEMFSDADLGL